MTPNTFSDTFELLNKASAVRCFSTGFPRSNIQHVITMPNAIRSVAATLPLVNAELFDPSVYTQHPAVAPYGGAAGRGRIVSRQEAKILFAEIKKTLRGLP